MFNAQKTFQARHYGPHSFPATGPLAPKWYIVDANGIVLGRLATIIARVLSGKHKATFTPHADTGDFVIVINADKVVLTGNKWSEKKYYDYSGYIGGLKPKNATQLLAKHPSELIERAVAGMLNKSALADRQIKKLKVYVGTEHPHSAQEPKPLHGGMIRKTILAKVS